jgi:hypothetical protein
VQAIRLSATTAVLAVLAMVAAPCAPARAQQQQQQQQLCTPEQTVAALDQYCESVPEAGGPVSTQIGGRPASSMPLASVLPSRDVARLRKAGGAAGRALLLLPVVAPVGSSPVSAQRRLALRVARRVIGRRKLRGEQVDPQTVVTGLVDAGNDVLGGAFRWGLVLCTAGFAGIGWLRIRTRFRV